MRRLASWFAVSCFPCIVVPVTDARVAAPSCVREAACGEAEDLVALVQASVTNRRSEDGALQVVGAMRAWGNSTADEAARKAQTTFRNAFVVSIDPKHYVAAHERLEAQGVHSEPAWGYNGSDPAELAAALQLLKLHGNTGSLHPTVNNWMACMHMSPGTPPNMKAALSELAHSAVRRSARDVDELLARDAHGCVPKVVAIAAAHVRLWEDLAADRLPSARRQPEGVEAGPDEDKDAWFLVMEDDAVLCPGWKKRLAEELPQAPEDADVLKLFFFGHWRGEDQVKTVDGAQTPFLEARDPLKGINLVTAGMYEVLKGASWKNVPLAGFYAGTQAYLIKREGARKLLSAIRGKPFQDIDMTMMSSVKHYVWRKVLTMSAGNSDDKDSKVSLLQTVPTCNREPNKDWFGW